MAIRKRNLIKKHTNYQIGCAGYSCKIYQMSNGKCKWSIYDFNFSPLFVGIENSFDEAYSALLASAISCERGTLRLIAE